ncbi:MAG: Asp-tRNA(Asn)/Glu-tRNA(Gln) amidotransferase subunit GatC [Chlamydiales bacterium]
MGELNRNTIHYLTELCRIGCPEEEEEELLADLNSIFGYIDLLQELDTENVEPCAHVIEGMVNVMREDHVGETLSRKEFLENAPDQIGGMIKVPTVVKKT